MNTTAKYSQVKASVPTDIAHAFKQACASSTVSMASVLSRFMADYTQMPAIAKAVPDYSTRRRRRAAIKVILKQLEQMRYWEERVRDQTPENLRDSTAYEATEEAISSLEEAIDALEGFWVVP